jgi:hypothetical protein
VRTVLRAQTYADRVRDAGGAGSALAPRHRAGGRAGPSRAPDPKPDPQSGSQPRDLSGLAHCPAQSPARCLRELRSLRTQTDARTGLPEICSSHRR